MTDARFLPESEEREAGPTARPPFETTSAAPSIGPADSASSGPDQPAASQGGEPGGGRSAKEARIARSGEESGGGGPEHRRQSFGSWLGEMAVLVVIAYVVATVIKLFIVQPFYIPSGSMEPTLMPGDRVLVNKFIYRFTPPKPGDIVVLPAPGVGNEIDLIKRIVAVGGQSVELREGTLFVDGKAISEPFVAPVKDFTHFGPYDVAPGQVFLMGDNRTNSEDSRFIGALPASSILGKAFIIYWPFSLQPGQHRLL